MKRATSKSKSAGFSLLELMISIVLGLLLIAGAIATYLSSKRSYSEAEQFSTLEETARFAELTMNDALLHAGFFGEAAAASMTLDPSNPATPGGDCTGPTTSNGRGAAAAYNLERYIFGGTISSSQTAISDSVDLVCITDGKAGTDVLVIKRAIPRPISDGKRTDQTQTRDGVLDNPSPILANTIYVLSNNTTGMLFNGSDTQPGVMVGGEVPYGTAWPYLFEVYYIRDADKNSEQFPPVLARKTVQWNVSTSAFEVKTEDLIEGVEDMRLRVGFDSDGDGITDTYSQPSAMHVNDWARVGSVEVYMLLRSNTADPQFKDTKTYAMGGSNTVTPVKGPDANVDLRQFRRLRVTTAASLRNPNLDLQK